MLVIIPLISNPAQENIIGWELDNFTNSTGYFFESQGSFNYSSSILDVTFNKSKLQRHYYTWAFSQEINDSVLSNYPYVSITYRVFTDHTPYFQIRGPDANTRTVHFEGGQSTIPLDSKNWETTTYKVHDFLSINNHVMSISQSLELGESIRFQIKSVSFYKLELTNSYMVLQNKLSFEETVYLFTIPVLILYFFIIMILKKTNIEPYMMRIILFGSYNYVILVVSMIYNMDYLYWIFLYFIFIICDYLLDKKTDKIITSFIAIIFNLLLLWLYSSDYILQLSTVYSIPFYLTALFPLLVEIQDHLIRNKEKIMLIYAIFIIILLFLSSTIQILDDGLLIQSFTETLINEGMIASSIEGKKITFFSLHGIYTLFSMIIYMLTNSPKSISYVGMIFSIVNVVVLYKTVKKYFNVRSAYYSIYLYLSMASLYVYSLRGFTESGLIFFILLCLYYSYNTKTPIYSLIMFIMALTINPYSSAGVFPFVLDKKIKKSSIIIFIIIAAPFIVQLRPIQTLFLSKGELLTFFNLTDPSTFFRLITGIFSTGEVYLGNPVLVISGFFILIYNDKIPRRNHIILSITFLIISYCLHAWIFSSGFRSATAFILLLLILSSNYLEKNPKMMFLILLPSLVVNYEIYTKYTALFWTVNNPIIISVWYLIIYAYLMLSISFYSVIPSYFEIIFQYKNIGVIFTSLLGTALSITLGEQIVSSGDPYSPLWTQSTIYLLSVGIGIFTGVLYKMLLKQSHESNRNNSHISSINNAVESDS